MRQVLPGLLAGPGGALAVVGPALLVVTAVAGRAAGLRAARRRAR